MLPETSSFVLPIAEYTLLPDNQLSEYNLPTLYPTVLMNMRINTPGVSRSVSWKKQVLNLAVYDRAYQGIAVSDVMMIHGEGNYATFYINSGKRLTVAKTLKQYEALLDERIFFRVHKSYLINLHYLKEYKTAKEETAVLKNGLRIGVARRRRKEFEVIAASFLRRTRR